MVFGIKIVQMVKENILQQIHLERIKVSGWMAFNRVKEFSNMKMVPVILDNFKKG